MSQGINAVVDACNKVVNVVLIYIILCDNNCADCNGGCVLLKSICILSELRIWCSKEMLPQVFQYARHLLYQIYISGGCQGGNCGGRRACYDEGCVDLAILHSLYAITKDW